MTDWSNNFRTDLLTNLFQGYFISPPLISESPHRRGMWGDERPWKREWAGWMPARQLNDHCLLDSSTDKHIQTYHQLLRIDSGWIKWNCQFSCWTVAHQAHLDATQIQTALIAKGIKSKRKITKNAGIFKITAHTLKRKLAEKQMEIKHI